MSETETTSASNGVTAAEPKKKRKVAAKKKPAKRSAKAAAKKSSKGAKAKSGKTSFVIWVDKKQGDFIKRKAAAAKMSQADYFRRALKLPASK